MKSTKFWFKRKLYGWGWTPASPAGWVITVIYVASLVFLFKKIDSVAHSVSDLLINFAVPFTVLTIVLVIVCYKTGEKPRWQWGKRIE